MFSKFSTQHDAESLWSSAKKLVLEPGHHTLNKMSQCGAARNRPARQVLTEWVIVSSFLSELTTCRSNDLFDPASLIKPRTRQVKAAEDFKDADKNVVVLEENVSAFTLAFPNALVQRRRNLMFSLL